MNKKTISALTFAMLLCQSQMPMMATSLGSPLAMTQTDDKTEISGTIVDEEGESLIHATVLEKGTNNGTVTDLDGKFRLFVKPGAILTVSYIGFTTKDIKMSTNMRIVMKEDNAQLNEVVVVGVSMKRSDLTGSISVVDSKVLEEKPVTNLNDALSGRVAGVSIAQAQNPSEESTISIRGINSINSGTSPIYVVDGVVLEKGNFNVFGSLNVADIESVQVLKDASATALYGSRGANGVVLVTTKRAKKGEGTVSYSGWVGFTTVANRPETMNAKQLGDLRIEAFANGNEYNNPGSDRQAYINSLMNSNIAFSNDEMDSYRNGNTYDWLDAVMKTGVQHNHTVSFAKATDKSNIYLSLNYTDIDGNVNGTSQKRYGGRVNIDTNIKDWLKIGTNTSFMRQDDNIPSDDVYDKALYANPMLNTALYQDPSRRYTWDYLTLYYRAHSEENNNDYNPFNSMEVTRDCSKNFLTTANYINISPIEGLNIRSTLAVNYNNQSWMDYTPSYIQEAIRHNSGDAKAKHERWESTMWQWDNTVSYDKTFAMRHRLNVMAGYSATRNLYNFAKAEGQRFASDDLGYYELGGAAAIDKKQIDSDFFNWSLASFVSRVNYSYDHRYYFTATVRADGSSKFGKGNKWGTFPSFSLAWDAANEAFMEPYTDWLSKLKLRAGYGVVGNQDIANFAYATLYYPQASNNVASYGPDGRRGTPNITWEKQKQTNLGIDLGFFNNRLAVSFDAFWITNDNLLMSHSLPTTSGYTTTIENIGCLENRGIEVNISATPVRTKDFEWNITTNLSHDRNKVTKLYSGVTEILSGDREGNIFLGEALGNLYTYRCGGIATEANKELWQGVDFNGKTVQEGDLLLLDLDGDNRVDAEHDREIVGNVKPSVYGGFATDFTYKGFSLNAVFNYEIGAKKFSIYYDGLINSVGLSSASTDLLDRWSPSNPNAKFPRVMANTNSSYNRINPSDSDFSLQDASFLRLSTLTLAYNFNPSLLKHIHLQSLRAYFTATNVFCATKYKGFDPERADGKYPSTRMFTVGLQFTL